MALSKDVYQTLEDIVGPENISEEPAILDAYTFQMGGEHFTANPGKDRFMPFRPEAVMLPGGTEEVQAIVRTCNRYKIKCKPFSTGWHPVAAPLCEGVILLDLRRMDRILEIDEQNMFAVVEPYVICGQLQAEAMKRGLNCHMIGAGASCSNIAISTSFSGGGPTSITMGYGAENLLGLEWVMPTGDILRTGSLGSGAGWFCGEGPGPSVRGIARGHIGAAGGLGVFTKAAIRLHPWPGPPEMPVEGVGVSCTSPLPDNFRAYTLAFPNFQAYADAVLKIWDAEIAYILHKQFNLFGEDLQAAVVKILSDPSKTIDNLEEMLNKPEIQEQTEEMRRNFEIVLAGNSVEEVEYHEKLLSQILAETGGRKVATMADPAMQRWVLLYMIKMGVKNLNYWYGGGRWTAFPPPGSPDFLAPIFEPGSEVKRKYIARGGLVDDGGDAWMGPTATMGGGGCGYIELFVFCDPTDTDSVKQMREFARSEEAARFSPHIPITNPTPLATLHMSREEREEFRSKAKPEVIYRFQRKIKEVFDPNELGDGGYL